MTRIRIQCECLHHVLETLHHFIELLRVSSWNWCRWFEVSLGLEAKAVDTKLIGRIKITTIHTRSTTSCTSSLIDFVLKSLPGILLCRIQCHTSSRPAITTPLSTFCKGFHDLLKCCEFSIVGSTYCTCFVVGKLLVVDMEHFTSNGLPKQFRFGRFRDDFIFLRWLIHEKLVDVNDIVKHEHDQNQNHRRP